MEWIGRRNGKITATKYISKDGQVRARVECICDCGTVKTILACNFTRTKSCGCAQYETSNIETLLEWKKNHPVERMDVTGEVYARLTAVRYLRSSKQGPVWEFQCECGNMHETELKYVRSGNTKSCGCLTIEHATAMGKKHGPKNGKQHLVDLVERFFEKVNKVGPTPTTCIGFGDCWIWMGGLDTKGRAQTGVTPSSTISGVNVGATSHTTRRASHVSWWIRFKIWPAFLCHRCDNPQCVNPDHLFEGNEDLNRYDREMKELGGIMVPSPPGTIAHLF